MDKSKFLSGIFSVYQSKKARNFRDSERYPIGFEAIFRNDAVGQEFAHNIQITMRKITDGKGLLFHIEGESDHSARHVDCFFKDVDTLRRVLTEALPGIALYHEDKGVLPKTMLIDQAKRMVSAFKQCA